VPSEIRESHQINIGDIVIWEMGSIYPFGHVGLVCGIYFDENNNPQIAILHAIGGDSKNPMAPHNVIFSLVGANRCLLDIDKVRFYSNTEISQAPRIRRLWELADISINCPDRNRTSDRIRMQMPQPRVSNMQTELITTALKIKNTGGGPIYYEPRVAQVVTGLPCFGSRAQKRLAKYYDRLQQQSTPITIPQVGQLPDPQTLQMQSLDSLGASTSTNAMSPTSTTLMSPTSTTLMSPTSTTRFVSPISSSSQSPVESPALELPDIHTTIISTQSPPAQRRPIVRHLTCSEFVILTYQLTFYNKNKSSGNMFIYRDARNTSPTGLARYLERTPGWVKYKLRSSVNTTTT
jgi:hypothetical protein